MQPKVPHPAVSHGPFFQTPHRVSRQGYTLSVRLMDHIILFSNTFSYLLLNRTIVIVVILTVLLHRSMRQAGICCLIDLVSDELPVRAAG